MHGMRQILIKLPFIIPVMLALTSCSTTGSMQNMRNMPVSPSVQHTQQIHVKHKIQQPHHTVTHTKQVVTSAKAMPHKNKVVSVKAKPAVVKPVVALQSAKKQAVQAKPVHPVQVMPVTVKPVQSIQTKVKPVAAKPAQPVQPTVQIQPAHIKPIANKMLPLPMGPSLLMSATSVDLHPRIYKRIGNREAIIANLRNQDNVYGQYHTIQVVRWDGSSPNESIINARTAILETIIGLSALENSIIKSNFGPLIVLLGGDAYIINLRGDPIEMVLIKGQPEKPVAPIAKPKHKRTSLHHGLPYTQIRNVVLKDFYITEKNGVIGVSITKE